MFSVKKKKKKENGTKNKNITYVKKKYHCDHKNSILMTKRIVFYVEHIHVFDLITSGFD